MQKILGLSFISLSLFISGMALAQVQSEQSKETPKTDAPKTAQPQSRDGAKEKVDGEFDLDGFFKKGEENAKNGASCDKPATPAYPIA